MRNIYSTWPGANEDKNKRAHYRLLRRLRIALFIWLIAFIASVIWFTYCP